MKDKKINPFFFFFFPLGKKQEDLFAFLVYKILGFIKRKTCFLNMLIFVILLKMRVVFNVKYSSEAL